MLFHYDLNIGYISRVCDKLHVKYFASYTTRFLHVTYHTVKVVHSLPYFMLHGCEILCLALQLQLKCVTYTRGAKNYPVRL